MLKILGKAASINVRKVLWTCDELDLPYEREDWGSGFRATDDPGFLVLNPNAMVPVLIDGDLVLWESNVIVRYLSARYAAVDTLYPSDLQRRFDAERWMDWQQTTLNPAGSPAFKQLFRTPPEQRQPALIEASRAAMAPLVDLLNTHLATRTWLLGERFTMADIPVACDVHRWWGLPLPTPHAPHVQRWFNAILARPATRGVLDLPLS